MRDAALGAGHVLVEHYATTYDSDNSDHTDLLLAHVLQMLMWFICLYLFFKNLLEKEEINSIIMNIQKNLIVFNLIR